MDQLIGLEYAANLSYEEAEEKIKEISVFSKNENINAKLFLRNRMIYCDYQKGIQLLNLTKKYGLPEIIIKFAINQYNDFEKKKKLKIHQNQATFSSDNEMITDSQIQKPNEQPDYLYQQNYQQNYQQYPFDYQQLLNKQWEYEQNYQQMKTSYQKFEEEYQKLMGCKWKYEQVYYQLMGQFQMCYQQQTQLVDQQQKYQTSWNKYVCEQQNKQLLTVNQPIFKAESIVNNFENYSQRNIEKINDQMENLRKSL